MSVEQFDCRSLYQVRTTFANADGTTKKLVCLAVDSAISRATSIIAESDDSSPQYADVWFTRDGSLYTLIGSVQIPAGAGRAGAPCVELMDSVKKNRADCFLLAKGYMLYVSMEAAITAGKTITMAATTEGV